MIIDGVTTTRDDGSTVCIGFGIDADGKTTGKFAIPKGQEWDAPTGTESVEYVNSMGSLPEVHSDYKTQP